MASIIQLINTHPVAAAAAAAIAVYVLARRMMPLFPNAARPATRDPVEAYGYTEEVKAVTREEHRVVDGVAPAASPAQKRAALAYHRLQPKHAARRGRDFGAIPRVCVVTGGTGFVGMRLVEMLVERGAEKVISFDVVPKPEGAWDHPAITWMVGDITNKEQVEAAVKGADCVWHNAAVVGPFHPQALYDKVNYIGTLNVLDACRKHGVRKIVMSSSPSTRFDGSDVDGLTEADMPSIPMKSYMQAYAGSKARGEKALTDACCDELMTVAVAPHQVYGPRDNLFVPNVMEAAGTGMLRVFASRGTGYGNIRVCFTHVDNYAHGLILAASALYKGSPALGKFYIVTDGDTHAFPKGYGLFWDHVDELAVHMGFKSIWRKVKLPDWLLLPVAYVGLLFGKLTGIRVKLLPFNVKVLTMHRWFKIDAAVNDLGYYPLVPFKEGWADMAVWTRENWLPKFLSSRNGGFAGIAKQSQRKIDIQAASALKKQ